MVVWREAGREDREGGVGDRLGLGILWQFGIGSCGICVQAGYFVSRLWFCVT